ncbi:hypothetical protein KFL01_14690 [Kocuria flava]|uniref:Toxin-antitoxin system HicB family antitoxin n=2 Tax=Kocuria flava TaxID=446860 RepID=A0ABQ0X3E3_9MICC|nr:hypothetical protein KFL01_14690 [Kocuria flava]
MRMRHVRLATMIDYKPPKMQGNKVPFSTRLTPKQHRLAAEAAATAGLSMAEYIGALIERDAELPNKLDNREDPHLPISRAS